MRTQFGDTPELDPEKAWVHLLPVPLEQTVSYGGGTSRGPTAILEASYQLENYDREFDCEPALDFGIFTHPEVDLRDDCHRQIEEAVGKAYDPKKLLGILGGEHSLTSPAVRAVSQHIDEITVVQLDAHADLRDQYEDTKLSHACVSRRLLENQKVKQILQLGVRSLCAEEAAVIKAEPRVTTWFAEDIHQGSYLQDFTAALEGQNVYITLDVDCFDPGIVPSTGTPEPHGLSYIQVEEIIRIVARNATIIAFDCVELAPQTGLHAADFTVAKCLYRLMSLCRFLRPTNR